MFGFKSPDSNNIDIKIYILWLIMIDYDRLWYIIMDYDGLWKIIKDYDRLL